MLTAQELKARGITTLQDALRAAPSVAVNSTGESYTQVRLRGAQANHTLVLIDGVEANAAGSGEYLFTGLTLKNVARIEVLRGPQSTLYGPNAMGGVISIITKEAEEGQQMGGSIEYGSHSSCATGFYLRQRGAKGGLSLESGDRQTEGEDGSRSGGDTEFNNQKTFSFKSDYALTDTLTLGGAFGKTMAMTPPPPAQWLVRRITVSTPTAAPNATSGSVRFGSIMRGLTGGPQPRHPLAHDPRQRASDKRGCHKQR